MPSRSRRPSAPICCTKPARMPYRNWATRLAAGVERLVELTTSLPVDTVAREIEFVFAAGSDYFFEIAKLRAARMLWAQAVGAFGPRDDGACRMRLHVRTPRRNKSVYDRYTNLLRVTTEAFVGGPWAAATRSRWSRSGSTRTWR